MTSYSIRLWTPNSDGFLHDEARTRVVIADEVDLSTPFWLTFTVSNPDGSVSKTTVPIEAVAEITATISSKEVRQSKRYQKEYNETMERVRRKREAHQENPGYR